MASKGYDGVRPTAILTDDYTITDADSGSTFMIGTDGKVMTLPSVALLPIGFEVEFINIGAAGNNIITIASAVGDYIAGTITLASTVVVKGTTVDKDLINTKSTAVVGDRARLISDGVNGWYCDTDGIWASE